MRWVFGVSRVTVKAYTYPLVDPYIRIILAVGCSRQL